MMLQVPGLLCGDADWQQQWRLAGWQGHGRALQGGCLLWLLLQPQLQHVSWLGSCSTCPRQMWGVRQALSNKRMEGKRQSMGGCPGLVTDIML
jgi:hypothetical protein